MTAIDDVVLWVAISIGLLLALAAVVGFWVGPLVRPRPERQHMRVEEAYRAAHSGTALP